MDLLSIKDQKMRTIGTLNIIPENDTKYIEIGYFIFKTINFNFSISSDLEPAQELNSPQNFFPPASKNNEVRNNHEKSIE